jgi:LPS-assembly protein
MLLIMPQFSGRLVAILVVAVCAFFSGVVLGVDEKLEFGFGAETRGSDDPVELAAQSGLRFEGNIGYASGPVVLAQGDTRVFAENAEFDRETRDFILTGSVRIYRGNRVFMAERAVYNLESQQLMAGDFRTAAVPLFAEGGEFTAWGQERFEVKEGSFTTSDSSTPGYSIRAGSVSVVKDKSITYRNVRLYLGRVPIFWVPILYQPLNREESFTVTPGYRGVWGAFVQSAFSFPVGTDFRGGFRIDAMSKRGIGLGFRLDSINPQPMKRREWDFFVLRDRQRMTDFSGERLNPNFPRPSQDRFRFSLKDKSVLDEGVYVTMDVNRMSDRYFLEDFAPQDFRKDPNPQSVLSVSRVSDKEALTLNIGAQLNRSFASGTERLPEVLHESMARPLELGGLFYQGQTSGAFLRRNYPGTNFDALISGGDGSGLRDYAAFRFDSFHQWTMPKTFFGWLNAVPLAAVRGTYYSSSVADGQTPGVEATGGGLLRLSVQLGLELSVKFTRTWENMESRRLGLDGLKHVIQPLVAWELVRSNTPALRVLPFDRVGYSSQLQPIRMGDFSSVDSISDWNVVRMGVRNAFKTRRDDETIDWLVLESTLDGYLERPAYPIYREEDGSWRRRTFGKGAYSNFYQRASWSPLPWLEWDVDGQLPIAEDGGRQLNSRMRVQASRDVKVSFGNRYFTGFEGLPETNLLTAGATVRLGDDWTFSVDEQFHAASGRLEYQRYELHRDLSSWVGSLGWGVWDRGVRRDVSFYLMFSLKDFPRAQIPLKVQPSSGSSNQPMTR